MQTTQCAQEDLESATRSEPVKVAFMIDNLGLAGTEKWLLRLISNLDRKTVTPYLLLLDGSSAESMGLEPQEIPVVRLGVKSFVSGRGISAARRLFHFFRNNGIDVVQFQFNNSTIFGAPIAAMAGVKQRIGTFRNAGYWQDRRTVRKLVIAARFLNRVACNSNASCEAAKTLLGVPDSSIVKICNGVDLVSFGQPLPIRQAATTDAPWQVGIVANLRPVKDVETFVKAACDVCDNRQDVKFLIVGDGPERGNIEFLISQRGHANRISLLGSITTIPHFLKTLDVAVLSSKSEGCSNALLEYFAAGRPVIASDVEGIAEFIVNYQNGILFPAGDAGRLAEAIESLLKDRNFALRIAENGRIQVESFDLLKESLSYQRLYYEGDCRPKMSTK